MSNHPEPRNGNQDTENEMIEQTPQSPTDKADQPRVVVYGGYGHTGRFIVNELLDKGIVPVLAGRDAERLRAFDPGTESPERLVATVDDDASLHRAFAGADVVINAAGPYLDTGLPVARAAVACGAHYLDLAAEQGAVAELHRELDAEARAAGVTVVPAMAFYGGLADLLVGHALAGDTRAARIEVAVWLDRWWPTEGTRITGERNNLPRLVVRDGHLVELGPASESSWTFAAPVGEQSMVRTPFSETITISRHIEVAELHSHLATGALGDVRDSSTPPPRPTDERGRSAQQFVMEVDVETTDGPRRVSASGRDIYAASAPLIVHATERLLDGRQLVSGAVAPAQAFDADDFLADLVAEGVLDLTAPATVAASPR